MQIQRIILQKHRGGNLLEWRFHQGTSALSRAYCFYGTKAECQLFKDTLTAFVNLLPLPLYRFSLALADDAGNQWHMQLQDGVFVTLCNGDLVEGVKNAKEAFHLIWKQGADLISFDAAEPFLKHWHICSLDPDHAYEAESFQNVKEVIEFLDAKIHAHSTQIRALLQDAMPAKVLSAFVKEACSLYDEMKVLDDLAARVPSQEAKANQDQGIDFLIKEIQLLQQMEGLLVHAQIHKKFGPSQAWFKKLEQNAVALESHIKMDVREEEYFRRRHELVEAFLRASLDQEWNKCLENYTEGDFEQFTNAMILLLTSVENLLFSRDSLLLQVEKLLEDQRLVGLSSFYHKVYRYFGRWLTKTPAIDGRTQTDVANVRSSFERLRREIGALESDFLAEKANFQAAQTRLCRILDQGHRRREESKEKWLATAQQYGYREGMNYQTLLEELKNQAEFSIAEAKTKAAKVALSQFEYIHRCLHHLLAKWEKHTGITVPYENTYSSIYTVCHQLVMSKREKEIKLQEAQKSWLTEKSVDRFPHYLKIRRAGLGAHWNNLFKNRGIKYISQSSKEARELITEGKGLLLSMEMMNSLPHASGPVFSLSHPSPLSMWLIPGLGVGSENQSFVDKLRRISPKNINFIVTQDSSLLSSLLKKQLGHVASTLQRAEEKSSIIKDGKSEKLRIDLLLSTLNGKPTNPVKEPSSPHL